MIDVMIADDQELIRESLELIISIDPKFRIVGSAKDGRQAVEMALDLRPDVILMDIRMPEINGIECVKLIKQKDCTIKIIMLTTFDDEQYVYEAVKYGADGFLLKGISKHDLLSSITTVHEGGTIVDPHTAQKIFSLFSRLANTPFRSMQEPDETFKALTAQEMRIMQLIGRGLSNKEIMNEVNFSEGTVRNYISNILKKLDLRDRTQIAILAIQSGLLLKNLESIDA
ncbi:response regulator transcription factor [Sphaerochaeta sp.]|jgi:DNA-binding NarL/FixJ family response regulator|uniref:response regulator transcription factor n=1 Tax=Sphaerochaeta sp. TaxID=1972642 RepID=UPI0016926E64|nr:response regulator transcription factor [Sphaerochaeta sp.]MDD2328993.1 response regulator transcription factor [bacterium]MDD4460061.1 response regulator transcription factor [Proteiniphilum sp.]MDX9984775.1 response regulator transcription factor [Sphaerochaeta sp.]NLE14980.1 response regulator transcription factor [Spirochaetales bacterium]